MHLIKFVLVVLCLTTFAMFYVEAAPSPREVHDLELDNFYEVEEERADRHRRVTCDLLSYGGKVNHSACAAHCLARGKAGGRCNNGVCQCRKTNFKDLFG